MIENLLLGLEVGYFILGYIISSFLSTFYIIKVINGLQIQKTEHTGKLNVLSVEFFYVY